MDTEQALDRVTETSAPSRRAISAVSPRIRYVARLFVAGALLAFVFSRVPLTSVIEAMKSADRTLILLAFVTATVVHFFSAARLKLLLASQGIGLSVWAVLEINLATRFYSLFLPGGNLTGMAIRVLKVSRLRKDVAAAGAAVFLDRLVASLVLCVLGVVFWLLQRPWPEPIWLGLPAVCAVVLVLVSWLLMRPRLLKRLGSRIPRPSWAVQLDPLRKSIRHSEGSGERVVLRVVVLTVAAHLTGVVCYWLVLASMALDLSPIAGGWIRSVMLLVTLLPISIAGLGVREAGTYLVMQSYGLGASTAVTYSLLITLVSILGTGSLGGLLESFRFASRGRV